MFLVSHDRAFLDNVVTQVIAFEGDGKLIEYVGGYEDWVRVKKYQATQSPSPLAGEGRGEGEKSKRPPHAQPSPSKGEAVKNKLSYKELRELEQLPKRIETLEREQGDIAVQLADGAVYRSDAKRARQLQIRNDEIDKVISTEMARWEELEKRRG